MVVFPTDAKRMSADEANGGVKDTAILLPRSPHSLVFFVMIFFDVDDFKMHVICLSERVLLASFKNGAR